MSHPEPHALPTTKNESGLLSLAFNVVVPVLILNKLSGPLGPLPSLFLALSFPLGFGLWDFFQRKKLNPLSALGFLNVSVTGGLAVLGLGGFWFSLKEAFFPLLIGLFVFASAWTTKPFIQSVFFNPQLIDVGKINQELEKRNNFGAFTEHLKLSTIFLSFSFFLSAILNFLLAQKVFVDLAETLDATEKAVQLNQQIAEMTKWSFLVIMAPSLVALSLILWHLISGIRQLTGLKTEEFLKG